jgi:hypothetical protein
VQHGKTTISNLPSLCWRVTIVDLSGNINVNNGNEQHDNAESNQEIFADTLHPNGRVA